MSGLRDNEKKEKEKMVMENMLLPMNGDMSVKDNHVSPLQ